MKRRSFLRMVTALSTVGVAGATVGACGSSNSSGGSGGGSKEMTYWLWQDDATDPTWRQLADKFNSRGKPGTVRLQVIPLAQFEDKLLTAIASGGGPDAARFKDWWLGEFVKAKALVPLAARANGWSGKSDVVPALLDIGTVPGDSELYMLPHQYTTLYMYYRPSMLSAASLQPPRTHADVLKIAETLAGKGRYAIDVRGGAGGQDQWAAWMYSGGARFVDDSGAVVLGDATSVAVNQEYLDLAGRLKAVPPGSITADFAAVRSNFIGGTTALMIHYPGSLNAVRKALGNDLGVVAMPTADPAKPSTLGSMSGNVVFRSSKNQDLAWEWISWLAEQPQMLTMSTSPQGQLPVLTSLAAKEPFATDAALKVAMDAQSSAQTWPRIPGTSAVVNKEWGPTIQAAFTGKSTSAQALQILAATLRGN